MSAIVRPTGTCFDDALDYIWMLVQRKFKSVEEFSEGVESFPVKLVHGVLLGEDGREFAHAWCEFENECIHASLVKDKRCYFFVDKDRYYEELSVKEARVYTLAEALELNEKYGHYGPWEHRYMLLTRKFLKERGFHG